MSWHFTLQAGTLESSRCPPEGGRYMNQNRVLTQTLLLGSWNDAGQIHGVKLVAARPPLDLEQDILSGFQARNGSPIFGHGINRGVVDLRNDVAASKAGIFGKACGVNRSDQRALHVLVSSAACTVGPEVFQAQAELGGR